MSKILFLTSTYLPNPGANGLITNILVEELQRRGHNVSCISVMREGEKNFEVINNIRIYRVTPSVYTQRTDWGKSNKYLNKAHRIIRNLKISTSILKYPNFDANQNKKIYKKIQEVFNKEHFDMVIAVCKPYANLEAISMFKRENKKVVTIAYYLDMIDSAQIPHFFPKKFLDRLSDRGNERIFNNVDLVLLPESNEKINSSNQMIYNNEKIKYIGFPTFRNSSDKIENKSEIKDDVIRMTYAGTLDLNYRNPEMLFKHLLKSRRKIELNIFGANNCSELIKLYSRDNLLIINHGLVDHLKVMEYFNNSHVVINVSNKNLNAIPSKIFELFSIGKPIINLRFDINELTNSYFEKFPYVFHVNNDQENVDSLKYFLNDLQNYQINLTEVRRKFILNTPEYTVDQFERIIENFEKDI